MEINIADEAKRLKRIMDDIDNVTIFISLVEAFKSFSPAF